MSNKETGWPAFPTSNWQKMAPLANGYHEGMTLRDYFAAKAMQGFAASDSHWPTADAVASNAYEWADAMLRTRGNK